MFVRGPLGGFHLLAAGNNAAVKSGVQISVWVPAFSILGIYPDAELQDHVRILFNF